MVARKPGRYLAPVALIAVAVAVGLIVRAQTHTHHAAAAPPPVHHVPVTRDVKPRQVFYVIKPGDSLSTISVKTGVSVSTLEALNPGVNPAALQTGARLRLRRQ